MNHRRVTERVVIGMSFAVGCLLVLMSCAPSGNSGPLPSSVEGQLAVGAPIYAQTCATSSCHGTGGEGIRSGTSFSAWPLVGADFQGRNPNAQVIFDVVRSGDEPNLRALTDQQIYDAIAYELSQNQISVQTPLIAANAFLTRGGAMSGNPAGTLYPPVSGVVLQGAPLTPALPLAVQNGRLTLELDQLAEAGAIGDSRPPAGGSFLIMVIELTDLNQLPISVSPYYLRLSTPTGESLPPQSIDPHSAIEAFRTRTISPGHGITALIIFSLSTPEQFNYLIYNDQAGNRMMLDLKH